MDGVFSVSDDGDVVAFVSDASDLVADDTNGSVDLFLHVRSTGATIRVPATEPNSPSLAGNGNSVVFLAKTQEFGRDNEVYRYNRNTGVMKCATCDLPDDVWWGNTGFFRFPSVSNSGRFVAVEVNFASLEQPLPLPIVILYDFQTGAYTLVSESWDDPGMPAVGYTNQSLT